MLLSGGFAALALAGMAQGWAGCVLTARFARESRSVAASGPLRSGPVQGEETGNGGPFPITVLKPLHGDEPLLAKALTTLCEQDYPPGFQIVFGVGDARDTAIPVVHALQARYPDLDIALMVEGARHGANPKVGNLINMLPAARHAIIVIADSDVHAREDYLRALARTLERPGVGLATTLYTGLPAFAVPAGQLGATQITHIFLPGALLSRALGRRDCLGATMALRRDTLERIGGLESLKDHLADDNVLGQRVRAAGLDVALAPTMVATTVPERGLAALWRHELRWARTIRALEPAGFAASLLQYPIFWALLAIPASAGASWAWGVFLFAWLSRALTATAIDRSVAPITPGLALRCPVWLLPARDVLSAVEWAASHAGRRVDWRGLTLEADTPPPPAVSVTPSAIPPGGATSAFSTAFSTTTSGTTSGTIKGSHAR